MSQADTGYGTFPDTVLGGNCDLSASLPVPVVTGARCGWNHDTGAGLPKKPVPTYGSGQQKRKRTDSLCAAESCASMLISIHACVDCRCLEKLAMIASHQPAIRFAITLCQTSFLEGSGRAACTIVRRRRRLPFHSVHGNT